MSKFSIAAELAIRDIVAKEPWNEAHATQEYCIYCGVAFYELHRDSCPWTFLRDNLGRVLDRLAR